MGEDREGGGMMVIVPRYKYKHLKSHQTDAVLFKTSCGLRLKSPPPKKEKGKYRWTVSHQLTMPTCKNCLRVERARGRKAMVKAGYR